jgi:2-polyprenyl-6-methoxyphenol hydroxylase-like FAD-dependent oxidoreductase
VVGVDRAFLRSTLLEGIEQETVFGAQVMGYTLQEDGVVARFADGTTSPVGCLLIGADGVRSAITKQLTKGALKVCDTGARMIHGSSPVAAFEGLGTGVFSIRNDTAQGGRIVVITNTVRKARTPSFGWVLGGTPGRSRRQTTTSPSSASRRRTSPASSRRDGTTACAPSS